MLGAIAQHLDKPTGRILLVEKARFANAPDALAVFARAPSLGAGGPFDCSLRDLRQERGRTAHFFRKDPAERLTKHFLLGPAQQCRCPLAPAGNKATDVERDDGCGRRPIEDAPIAIGKVARAIRGVAKRQAVRQRY